MPDCPNPPVVSELLPGILFALVFYWALIATFYRAFIWKRTASPLPIPLTPAPQSRAGVVGRLLLELVLFRSLARASLITWVGSILFHYGLLWLLIMHLRLLFPQLPLALLPFIQFSGWALLAMMSGLLILLLRRCLVDRVRYVSSPSDYLHLLLLMAIGITGALIKRHWPADLYSTGEFLRGALTAQWQSLPDSASLMVHLALVSVLLLIFPVSKLIHSIGIVFSPTWNQRER